MWYACACGRRLQGGLVEACSGFPCYTTGRRRHSPPSNAGATPMIRHEDPIFHEPQTDAEARHIILRLKNDIARIQAQLSQPERRAAMDEKEYADWSRRALMALGHRKDELRRVERWQEEEKKESRGVYPHHSAIGTLLLLAAKQYGRLLNVLIAAEHFINSPSEEEDERLFWILAQSVADAREIIGIEAQPESAPAQEMPAQPP